MNEDWGVWFAFTSALFTQLLAFHGPLFYNNMCDSCDDGNNNYYFEVVIIFIKKHCTRQSDLADIIEADDYMNLFNLQMVSCAKFLTAFHNNCSLQNGNQESQSNVMRRLISFAIIIHPLLIWGRRTVLTTVIESLSNVIPSSVWDDSVCDISLHSVRSSIYERNILNCVFCSAMWKF